MNLPSAFKHVDANWYQSLLKKCEDEEIKADLTGGIDAAERVLKKANEAVDRDLLEEALEDLIRRVDDWKNHRVESFGRLLLHGVYTVVTGRSEQEKDVSPINEESSIPEAALTSPSTRFTCLSAFSYAVRRCNQIKTKDKKDKNKSAPKVPNKNNKLQLKGRIFMTNVTEVISFAKPGKQLTYSIAELMSNSFRFLYCTDMVEG